MIKVGGVQLKGLDAVIKAIERKGEQVETDIKRTIFETASDIERDAIISANGSGLSTIGQRIEKQITDQGFKATVGVQGDDPLPAYFEFGTGASAREILAPYPEEIKAIARQFFISGDGRLVGRPYLFPAFFKAQAEIQRRLNQIK